MSKLMLIKKGGRAMHQLGDLSRDVLDAEPIYVHDETETEWIGHYLEGFGFIDVHFLKSDCRDATEREIELCESGRADEIVF